MRSARLLLLTVVLIAALSAAGSGRAAAQFPPGGSPPGVAQLSRAGGAAVGIVMGTLAGGYITLAIVVARSRAGHYVESISDLLGWQTAPVLVGAFSGLVLGYVDHRKMIRGSAYAVGGAVTGYVLGRIVGQWIWDPPEGTWAGGAIGAGVGVVAAGLIGAFVVDRGDGERIEPAGITIPIAVRLRL